MLEDQHQNIHQLHLRPPQSRRTETVKPSFQLPVISVKRDGELGLELENINLHPSVLAGLACRRKEICLVYLGAARQNQADPGD